MSYIFKSNLPVAIRPVVQLLKLPVGVFPLSKHRLIVFRHAKSFVSATRLMPQCTVKAFVHGSCVVGRDDHEWGGEKRKGGEPGNQPVKWTCTHLLSLLRYTLTRINSIRTWSYSLFYLHTLLITIEITKGCKHYL